MTSLSCRLANGQNQRRVMIEFPLSRVLRSFRMVLIALTLVIIWSDRSEIFADDGDAQETHWERLRSMSLDQRHFLADKLKQFDELPREEQQLIRKLDGELQKLPRQNRDEAYSVIRRYHLWLSTLSEADRNELNALASDKKLDRIRALRKEQSPAPNDYPGDLHPPVFGSNSPYDLANQVKTWLALTPDRKTSLMNLKESERGRRLNEYRQELKISPVSRPAPSAADEQFAIERWRSFRNQFNSPALKKFDDPENKEFQEKKARRLRRLAENRSFEVRPAEKVQTDRLLDFASRMPPWIRSLFDPLSPERARQQLTLLYRLVFPVPSEITPSKAAGNAAAAKGNPGKKAEAAPATNDVKPPNSSQPF